MKIVKIFFGKKEKFKYINNQLFFIGGIKIKLCQK